MYRREDPYLATDNVAVTWEGLSQPRKLLLIPPVWGDDGEDIDRDPAPEGICAWMERVFTFRTVTCDQGIASLEMEGDEGRAITV